VHYCRACHVNDITYLIAELSARLRRRLRSVTDVPIGSYARRDGCPSAARSIRVARDRAPAGTPDGRVSHYPLLAREINKLVIGEGTR